MFAMKFYVVLVTLGFVISVLGYGTSDRDTERRRSSKAAMKTSRQAFNYDDFNRFDDISIELNNMINRCQTDLGIHCDVTSVGQTHEGRNLWLFTMRRDETDRKGVWIDATIHSREWLATATHLKIMQHLIDDYSADSEVKRLVDTYDWYLMPVINPDGYEFTWLSNRQWRKNRSPTSNPSCFGTDLNRNFDQEWGVAGADTDPCNFYYRGSAAASELETQAVQTEANRLGSTLMTSFHLHTCTCESGNLWLIPWGTTNADGSCKYAVDHDVMVTVANAGADAIEKSFNTTWTRGNSCEKIYPASGVTMDYFKDVGGVKYTATLELRGNGSHIIDADQIDLSFQEIWNGIVAAIDAAQAVSRAATPSPTMLAITSCCLSGLIVTLR